MKVRAKFIDKTRERRFNEDFTIYFWEYRGMTYTTYVNHNKGNEPLAWQHKSEQSRIDAILDNKTAQSAGTCEDTWKALDLLFMDVEE